MDEDSAIDDEPCDGEGDDEPSLSSFDRLSNQLHGWKSRGWGVDCELDRCDDEDSDPREAALQPVSLNHRGLA